MTDDKIKYSDLIAPDDSIERLIKQLEQLNSSYGETVSAIKAGAKAISDSLKSASGATKEKRREIDEAAVAADRLKRAEQDLAIALTETGRQIAWLKSQTSEVNRASVANKKALDAEIGSYDKLRAELADVVRAYKALSAEERVNSESGKAYLQDILRLKDALKRLDDQMKPHIQQLTEVEKAEQRLAFLSSEQGKQYLELQKRIREITNANKERKASLTPLEQSERKLIQAQSEENVLFQQNNILTQEANRIAKLQARVNISVEDSYERLSAQYELNKIALNKMTKAQRENTDEGKKLVLETYNIYQKMIDLQEATGKYSLSVGNYGKAWNGLNFAMQQTVRELPALAIGFQTFFLGISNNLPYVIDEINALRNANKLAAQQGQATIPITKAILGSIFNWQTALIILITVLSSCGDEIYEWARRAFGAKSSVMSLTKAIKNINKELESTNASYGDNVVKIKHLQAEWKKLQTIAEKTKWLKDNKTELDNIGIAVNNINDADNAFVDNTEAVLESFKARAKAAAANKLAAEKYEEALLEEQKVEARRNEGPGFWAQFFANAAEATQESINGMEAQEKVAEMVHNNQIKRAETRVEALMKEGDQYFELAGSYIKAQKKRDGGGGGGDSQKDPTEYIANMKVRILRKTEAAITKLEEDEFAKRKKATLAKYAVENAELQKTYEKNQHILFDTENEYEDLTEEQKQIILKSQEDIRNTIVTNQQLLVDEIAQIEKERQVKELEILGETLQLRLNAVQKGSREEYELRRRALENERNLALSRNNALPASQRQSDTAINAAFDKKGKLEEGAMYMDWFTQYQALEEAQFNALKQNERDVTRFKLQQEKDRWKAQIQLAEMGGLDWTQAQIDAAKAAVKGIDRELKDLDNFAKRVGENGLGVTLLQMTGLDDDTVNAVVDSASVIIDQINAIMDAEIKAKEKAVELAQERVDAAQSAVDAEIEARKNGYANSVAVAKAELEMEKRNQRQKEKELKRAQQAQEAINSVTQASSLITATANLLAGWSSIPIIGQALAITAIGVMWGTFAAAKIRAAQLTSKYGEGGLEFLEGGSHASGNDIDLGVNNSKNRRMKAEGGEALAIINKRNSRKYRKVLPDVIDSFNRGTFEQKYLNAFNNEGQPIFVTNQSNNIDLSRIEADIRAIKDRNSTQIYTLPDGSVIMQKKNVKRIIHQ